MITEQNIEEVKNRIVKNFNLEKIILFGSYANGNATNDSDLDLVVIQESDLPSYKRVRPFKRQLRGIGFPIDILVYTPQEVDYWKETSMAFITQVLKDGKVLYGK